LRQSFRALQRSYNLVLSINNFFKFVNDDLSCATTLTFSDTVYLGHVQEHALWRKAIPHEVFPMKRHFK